MDTNHYYPKSSTSKTDKKGRDITTDSLIDVTRIGTDLSGSGATHEFIGLSLLSNDGYQLFKKMASAKEEVNGKPFNHANFTDLVNEFIARGLNVKGIEVYKGWIEIRSYDHYIRALELLS